MEIDNKKIRRRKIFIEKSSQLYMSVIIIVYLIIYTIITLGIMLGPSIMRFSRTTLPLDVQLQASREFLLMDQRVVPVFVVLMIIMAIHFLFITHRIFGPIYRLKNIMGEWSRGIWPKPFKPRSKDFHREFFSTFNITTAKTREDFIFLRDRLNAALESLKEMPGEGIEESATSRSKTAEGYCREALERLDTYHL